MWAGTAVEPPGTRLLLGTQLLCLRPPLLAPSNMWLGMLSLSRAGNHEQSVVQAVAQAMIPTEHRSEYRLQSSAEYRIETLKIICCNGRRWERERKTQGTRMSSRTGAGGGPTEDRRPPDRGRAGAGRRTSGRWAEDRRAQGGGQGGRRAEDRAYAGQKTGGPRAEDKVGQGGGQGGRRTEDGRAPGGGQDACRAEDRADARQRTGGRQAEDRRAPGGGQGGGRRTGGLRAEDRWHKTHNNQRKKAPTMHKDERKAEKKYCNTVLPKP